MCTDCNEKLCGECRIHHERSKASAWHHLVSMSGDVGLLPDVTVYESCHQHGGRPFEVYCVDHNAMGCSTCTLVTHRQCNNVKPMDEVIQKTTATPSPVEAEWKELTEETKTLVDEDDVAMAVLITKESEVLTDVTNKIQKAKDKLDDLKAISQSDVADTFRECRKQLLSRRKCINEFHINAENSSMLLSGQEQLSARHHFCLKEQTKNQISGHYRRMIQYTNKEPNRFDVSLKLDAVIDDIMKMTILGNVDVTSSLSPVSQNAASRIDSLIGSLRSTSPATNFADSTSTSDLAGSLQHLTVQTTEKIGLNMTGDVDFNSSLSPVSQNAASRVDPLIGRLQSTSPATNFAVSTSTSDLAGSLQHLTVQTTHATTAVDVWNGSVSCVHTFNADTLEGVGNPWLTGGIFTDNNELLITDHNTNKLLLFDDKYSYLREFKVDGRPTDIARGRTADEIFVAIGRYSILRCTLEDGKLFVVTQISAPPGTWGIAALEENILVGTLDRVNVMSVDGKITKSIKKEGRNTYLAVSTANSTVYHSDNNDVVCRRLDNDTVVFRYRNPSLNEARGIGVDRDHNVYVCGHRSSNVFLISSNGSRGRVLLPKLSGNTGSNPYGIVVHPTKQEFVVTSSTRFEVYRFCDNN